MNFNVIAHFIANSGIKALINEVSCSPKPGLVDRHDNGAHKDMNFFTFIDSTMAIAPFLEKFALIGFEFKNLDNTSLPLIRPIGIECEKAMFKATNGVNTHKGAIFSLGIISACSAYCYKNHSAFLADKICEYAAIMAAPAMEDFCTIVTKSKITKGEKLYIDYGITGIRGEAAGGYKSVLNFALPALRESYKLGQDTNTALLQTLLALTANVEDTNILGRCTFAELEFVKKISQKAVELGGATTDIGKRFLVDMNNIFISKNISPGGSADLLAVSNMLYLLEKYEEK